MKSNRRDFLKFTGIAGIHMVGSTSLLSCADGKQTSAEKGTLTHTWEASQKKYEQQFNMSGYAAPKIETVRVGFIGLGNRGGAAVERISYLDGVAINALCDVQPEKVNAAKARIKGLGHDPQFYSSGAEAWKEVCDSPKIDLVYICTHWALHTPIALYAMRQGKHVAVEIPAATTMEDCWQLVETSEKTRKHCVMLENCCYDFFELLTLNMAQKGFFGELVHGEGAYIHDILESFFDQDKRWDFWRLKENAERNGNLYPTHGFGPICQAMGINRGDKLEYMVSMSSNDFMLAPRAAEEAEKNTAFEAYRRQHFRGNMNTSTIRTNKGRTIMVQHDVSSPRPYSRIHLLSGTKATAQKYPLPGKIAVSHEGWLSDEEMREIEAEYTPAIVKKIGDLAKHLGGHGGMDFMMDWRLVDCLRNGLPMDMDVYDAASWSAIGPLSEWSVANKSRPIEVPDFTGGKWQKNKSVDLSLEKGGTTGVKV
ncbi:Gfo/Idh/MocA family oxidoreductase [Olivibacter sp. SDN3]|uniref:Gfo/Idh/MocA family protein n=1 Tax=Olivibacter sp. SDN3 TaxID=2764720 RepID=UPI001650FF7E|nr:Gfo/Idh/MocA family oxidoreductase [Olivibacter sp. SDN3]QNL52351.1 Gfo/Idh/MocA family oxidoreductase [Olivibacter sp. SDN3]